MVREQSLGLAYGEPANDKSLQQRVKHVRQQGPRLARDHGCYKQILAFQVHALAQCFVLAKGGQQQTEP